MWPAGEDSLSLESDIAQIARQEEQFLRESVEAISFECRILDRVAKFRS